MSLHRRAGFDRRTFFKAAGTVAGAGFLSRTGLMACADEAPLPSATDEQSDSGYALSSLTDVADVPSDSAVPATDILYPRDGSYLGTAEGHEGPLHLEVTFGNGAIMACRCLSHTEKPGIGTYACDRIPEAIVAAQSTQIDTVAGATVTSQALLNAARQAIQAAGGSPDVFASQPDAPDATDDVSVESCDVVIAGAGIAGLICALRLLETGRTVIVLEKQDIPGGSAPLACADLLAPASEIMSSFAPAFQAQDPCADLDALLAHLAPRINPLYDRFAGAMPYQTAQYAAAGELVDWLYHIGVGFCSFGTIPSRETLFNLAPGPRTGGAASTLAYLTQRVNDLGGHIIFGARATRLMQDSDSTIRGILASCQEKTIEIRARAVALATGGYGANKACLTQYSPALAAYSCISTAGSTGDSISMTLNAGGRVECVDRLPAFVLRVCQSHDLYLTPTGEHRSIQGLLVDSQGNLVCDLDATDDAAFAAMCAERNPEEPLFVALDVASVVEAGNPAAEDPATWRALHAGNYLTLYANPAEAAQACDLPCLEQSILQVLQNYPNDAGSTAAMRYRTMQQGLYLLGVQPAFCRTPGGLAIDTSFHVLGNPLGIIPGLYAAGDVCGSLAVKDGCPCGEGFDEAAVSGYLMAQTINDDIASVVPTPADDVYTVEEDQGTRIMTPWYSFLVPSDFWTDGWSFTYDDTMREIDGDQDISTLSFGHRLDIIAAGSARPVVSIHCSSPEWMGTQGLFATRALGPVKADANLQVVIYTSIAPWAQGETTEETARNADEAFAQAFATLDTCSPYVSTEIVAAPQSTDIS